MVTLMALVALSSRSQPVQSRELRFGFCRSQNFSHKSNSWCLAEDEGFQVIVIIGDLGNTTKTEGHSLKPRFNMIQLLTIFEAVQSLMQKESVANFKAVLNLIYRPQDMNFPEAEVAFIWVPFQAQNNDIASYAWELRYF